MPGRGRSAGLYPDRLHRQRQPFRQSLRESRILGQFGIGPPARVQQYLPLGRKAVAAALCHYGSLGIPIGRADRPEQTLGDQPQNLPLSQGQGGNISGSGAPGGDNRVVIGDLLAVADLGCQDFLWRVQTPDGSGGGDQLRNRAFHIIGQKAAVRSGIGTQFLFIEGLEVIQGLLGGVAQGAIGLPL